MKIPTSGLIFYINYKNVLFFMNQQGCAVLIQHTLARDDF